MNEFLTIRGRGKRLVAKASTMENTVVIRVDDERNDEFWLEVHLDREQVENLLRQMDEGPDGEDDEEVVEVEVIDE